jgi:predicted Zn-dependent peptidase
LKPRSAGASARGLLPLVFLAFCPSLGLAAPTLLADSTVVESWVLKNGLRVVTRHLPRASAASVTLAYRAGSADDPSGKEGLASLLAEIVLTAEAGEVPERTRTEMTSLRPLGWSLKTTRHHTAISEAADPKSFPGVLHQVAARLRGVTPTEARLRAAIASVKSDLADDYSKHPERVLYYTVGDLAAGVGKDAIERYGSGKGLERVTLKEVRQRLAAAYVPANAVLAVIGDLSAIDPRRLIEGEFGNIPAGPAPAPRPAPSMAGGNHRLVVRGLDRPFAALGVIAPALTDTLHPAFYLNAMLFGSYLKGRWDRPDPPLSTRFQYIVLDDPEVVRFYPPVLASDSTSVAEELVYSLREMPPGTIDAEFYSRVRSGVGWLLGGPLPAELIPRIRTDPSSLLTLSASMATRELRGGDAFWSSYRQRLEAEPNPGVDHWREYFLTPANRVELRIAPAP